MQSPLNTMTFGRMVWGAGSGLANANGRKSARPPWHKKVGSMILTQANTAKSLHKTNNGKNDHFFDFFTSDNHGTNFNMEC